MELIQPDPKLASVIEPHFEEKVSKNSSEVKGAQWP